MRPIAVLGTAVLFAATPASILLIGNATFSEEVPVRVPATAVLLDEHGHTPSSSRPLAPVDAKRPSPRSDISATPSASSDDHPHRDHADDADDADNESVHHHRQRGRTSSGGGNAGHDVGDDAGQHQRRGDTASGDNGSGHGSDDGGSGSSGHGSSGKRGSGGSDGGGSDDSGHGGSGDDSGSRGGSD